ncbi:MAG: sigma-70 family RNA polymerase sigma factor [Bacilli bacterium]
MNNEQLIMENAGLIWKIANRFYNVDKKDLFQAGALGILKAYRNYKENGVTKFSTYAYDYIFGEMHILASNKEIKISKDIIKLRNELEKTRYILAQKLCRIPSNMELANFLEMDVEKITLALNSANAVMSLDEESDDARNLYESIAYNESLSQDDLIMLDSSINTLDEVEKDIINSRYYEDLTQTETARKLGLSQVMVSRYEKRSLEKMHDYMYL